MKLHPKPRRGRLVSMAAAFALAIPLAASPALAQAADDHTPYSPDSSYQVGGVNYVDVYGGSPRDLTNAATLAQKAVTTPIKDGKTVFDMWEDLAVDTILLNGAANYGNSGFTYGNLDVYACSMFGEDYYGDHRRCADYQSGIIGDFFPGGDFRFYEVVQPTLATGMPAVAEALKDPSLGWRGNIGDSALGNTRSNGPVIYSVNRVYANANQGSNWRYGFATVLYDFALSYVSLPEGLHTAGDGYESLSDAADAGVDGVAYAIGGEDTYSWGVTNFSPSEIQATQGLTRTASTSVTNETSITNETGWQNMTGVEVTVGVDIPLVAEFSTTLKNEFTIMESTSTTDTNSKTLTDEVSQESSTAVNLPPHTRVQVVQSLGDTSASLKYDYPVAIKYKVKIVELGLGMGLQDYGYEDTGISNNRVIATFGEGASGDAVTEMLERYANRGVAGYDAIFSNNVQWGGRRPTNSGWLPSFFATGQGLFGPTDSVGNRVNMIQYPTPEERVNNLRDWRPLSVSGAELKIRTQSIDSQINDIVPVYPLARISTPTVGDVELAPDDSLYVDGIELNGYNEHGVAYYGFDQEAGGWALVDTEGNPVGTSTDVADLITDPVNGNVSLKAKADGAVYLRYYPDRSDESYAVAGLVADSELSTATVKVVVTGAPFDGTITLAGDLSRPVNDSPVSLSNPANGITVTVVDSTGKELNRALTWDAKELPARGILIEDGRITFTQEGTFHVRAASGGVYSDWFEVTALPARALNSLAITDPYDPPLLTADLDPDGPEIDLSGLRVTALDQYGDPIAFDPADLVWALDGPATASILDGTSLIDATEAGRWTLTISTGGVTSNVLDVTIVGPQGSDAPVVTGFTVSTQALPEVGGEVTATITGADLPSTAVVTVDGGSVIAAAVTEHPTTGGSTVRTATFTLPANSAGTAEVYTVGYRLGAPGTSAGATTVKVTVAPSLAIDPEDNDDGEGGVGTGAGPGSESGASGLPATGNELGADLMMMTLSLLALGLVCVHTARRQVQADRA